MFWSRAATNRWAILAVPLTARLSVAIALQVIAAVLPFMIADLAISYAQAGMLIGLFMLPGIVLAIPSGWLAARFGDEPITLLSLVAMTVGSIIVAQSTSFTGAAIGRVMCGSGVIVLNVRIAKMTIGWFAGREIATAMAVFVSSWPAVLHVAAAPSALGIVLIATIYRPPPTTGATAAAPSFRLGRRSLGLAVLAGGV